MGHGLAVGEGVGAHLATGEARLDDHAIARRAELATYHDGVDRLQRSGCGVGDDDAFTLGQTVRFHH